MTFPGMEESKALDEVKLVKYCCRRMFLGHPPQLELEMLAYYTSPTLAKLLGWPMPQQQQQQQQQPQESKEQSSTSNGMQID
jgi:hypothetical protein